VNSAHNDGIVHHGADEPKRLISGNWVTRGIRLEADVCWRETLHYGSDRLSRDVAEHPSEVTQVIELPGPYLERSASYDLVAALHLDRQETDSMTGP
jgi:hypothetical protein